MAFEDFLALCPPIQPRLFTISSSNLVFPNSVHITDSLLIDDLPNSKDDILIIK